MDDSSVKLKVMKEKQFNMELGQGMRQMDGRKDLMEDMVIGGKGLLGRSTESSKIGSLTGKVMSSTGTTHSWWRTCSLNGRAC